MKHAVANCYHGKQSCLEGFEVSKTFDFTSIYTHNDYYKPASNSE